MQYIILPALLLLMYLLVIRPQQQRIREQQQLVASLQVGEEVISSAGIFGTITALTDEVATLAVADGVQIRVARPAIARRIEPGALPEPGIVETGTNDIVTTQAPDTTQAAADEIVDPAAAREE